MEFFTNELLWTNAKQHYLISMLRFEKHQML